MNENAEREQPRRCQVREDGGYHVVTVAGEVDLSWSTELRDAILKGLDASKPVLVELSQVSYIDSSGMASFVEGYQRARKARLKFMLVAASPPVMAVLKLARLDRVLPLAPDLATAHAAAG